jgi:hypothetical protein
MINLNEQNNTNRFAISMDAEEVMATLRALYWYQDKITNMERRKGRDDAEWDIVSYLRQQLGEVVKKDVYI